MVFVPTLPSSPIPVASSDQVPQAVPVGVSLIATTGWSDLIVVPQYDVPETADAAVGAGDIKDGVAEIITPLMLTNTHTAGVTVSVRTVRGGVLGVMYCHDVLVPPNETASIPVNGQVFYSGDTLEVQASVSAVLHCNMAFQVGLPEQVEVRV